MPVSETRVAILGAGTMGTGIARLCLERGVSVALSDPLQCALDHARKTLEHHFDDEPDLRTTLGEIDVHGCAIVIDALPQVPDRKRDVLARALEQTVNEVPIATVTLAEPVHALRPATPTAATRVVGMHFMNPPHRLPICELIVPTEVDDAVERLARDFLATVGVNVVDVPDTPGFVLNRALMPLLLTAAELMGHGQLSAEEIDRLFVVACGHPMGLLQVLDLVGLDVALQIARVLADAGFGEVPMVLERNVAEGRLGRKTGRGFYTYGGE